ncbi:MULTISPECIES: amidohydrolase [Salinibaculum]|uniref:amidohydrolase n=1 Tax=Salinibaculum TaxID=2732368 RepID=UPI0030D5DF32
MAYLTEKTLSEVRRDLHAHPETGWKEFRTTALVAEELEERGYDVSLGANAVNVDGRLGVPEDEELAAAVERARREGAPEAYLERQQKVTGLVAEQTFGDGSGPVVGVRVDMDALERAEAMDDEHRPAREGFASTHMGEMHACGHDAHTAIGLGLAREFAGEVDFDGTLRLFFQPAEEGGRGGKPMSETDHITDVDFLLAVHVGLDMETGTVDAARERPLPNAKVDVTFRGEPAHAGQNPQAGRNALLTATTAINNLYAIPRHSDGKTRINVGHVHSPNPQNIIPEEVEMRIEVRGGTTELSDYMQGYAEQIVQAAADMHNVDIETELYGKTTTFEADEYVADVVATQAATVAGVEEVFDRGAFSGSEDASYLIRKVQQHGGEGTYVGIGASNTFGHHHQRFDIDEDAIEIGVDVLARSVRSV